METYANACAIRNSTAAAAATATTTIDSPSTTTTTTATTTTTKDKALDRIQELFVEMNDTCPAEELTAMSYNRVCHALVNCRHVESANAARAILDKMCQRYLVEHEQEQQHKNGNQEIGFTPRRLELTEYPFSIVMTAYGRAGRAREAEALLESMEQLAEQTGNPSLRPTTISWNSLIWAHAQVGDNQRAEAVLFRFLKIMNHRGQSSSLPEYADSTAGTTADHPVSDPRRTLEVWNGVLTSWAQSDDPNALDYIESVIERLETMGDEATSQQPNGDDDNDEGHRDGGGNRRRRRRLTTSTYNTLLTCYARQKTTKAAELAEDLLKWMEASHPNENGNGDNNSNDKETDVNDDPFRPDSNSYLNVLLAWSNIGNPERCEQCLFHLCERIRQGKANPSVCLTQQHFNVVLEAWVKKSNHARYLEKATAVMDWMKEFGLQPDAFSYTSLMWAWAKSKTVSDPAKQVKYLFRQLIQQSQEQGGGDESFVSKPDAVTFNVVLYALARSPDPKALNRVKVLWQEMKDKGVKPNAMLYNTFMSVWSRRNRPQETEQVFQELLETYQTTQDESFRPDARSYNACLQAWSKAGDPERTAKVLQEWTAACDSGMVVDAMPSTKHFNAVLHAWLRSDHPESAQKAESGLRQMIQLAHESPSVVPSTKTASSKEASTRWFDCCPDSISYTSVISAFAKSDLPDAGLEAFRLLNEMKELVSNTRTKIDGNSNNQEIFPPNFRTYTQVLQALCRTTSQDQSYYDAREGSEKGSASSPVVLMEQLLDELHQKSQSFWQPSNNRNDFHSNFRMIKETLNSSSIYAKDELLANINRLELTARQARQHQPDQGNTRTHSHS